MTDTIETKRTALTGLRAWIERDRATLVQSLVNTNIDVATAKLLCETLVNAGNRLVKEGNVSEGLCRQAAALGVAVVMAEILAQEVGE